MDLMFRHGMTPTQRLMWLKKLAGGGGGGGSVLKTITGSLLHITDALAKPAVSFEVGIEPQQDLHGQDAPYPSGGGKNKAKFWQWGYFNASGIITGEGAQIDGLTTPIFVASGNSIVMSVKEAGRGSGIGVFSDSEMTPSNLIYRSTDIDRTLKCIAYTATQDCYVSFWFNLDGTTPMNDAGFAAAELQIELGVTVPTSYAPYSNECPITGHTGANVYRSGADTSNPTTIPIAFPDSAGTVYGCTLTNNGTGVWKLRVTHKSIELNGSENWIISTGWVKTNTAVFYISGYVTDAKYDDSGCYWLCNEFNPKSRYYIYNYDAECAGFTGSQGNSAPTVRINKTTASDATAFKTWLNSNPLQLCYKLITPIEYTLTETQALSLLKGENSIWVNNSDDLELQYYAKAEETP